MATLDIAMASHRQILNHGALRGCVRILITPGHTTRAVAIVPIQPRHSKTSRISQLPSLKLLSLVEGLDNIRSSTNPRCPDRLRRMADDATWDLTTPNGALVEILDAVGERLERLEITALYADLVLIQMMWRSLPSAFTQQNCETFPVPCQTTYVL